MFECRINLALEHFINFLRLSFGGFILADVTEVLCELELTIKKVKVSTTPDGRVIDLFFVTDTRFCIHFISSQAYYIFAKFIVALKKNPLIMGILEFMECTFGNHIF